MWRQLKNNYQVEIRDPLIVEKAKFVDEDDYAVEYQTGKNKGHQWILYLTTIVTVCGSFCIWIMRKYLLLSSLTFVFLLLSQIGFLSPIQSAITEDLNLTVAELLHF
ncbi:hypothetical protein POM88_027798 [Heracleum sosnowskyi]|uniref:Uncharacterized protein n=1 Tax=Heracleum sosnowskyi TaxID=360622 RepID=A0AAD8I8H2_9APIA|nr:hypothetical protein POM88_027798 [Heracleum sosnowskyi]